MLRSPGQHSVPLCESPGIKFHFWKHLDVHVSRKVTRFRAFYVIKMLQECNKCLLFLHLWKRLNVNWINGDKSWVWACAPITMCAIHLTAQVATIMLVLIGQSHSPVLLFYCPSAPASHHPGPKITAVFAQAVRRGIPALPAWTWNPYHRRLSHQYTPSPVVHPACLSSSWRPRSNPLLCVGLGWCPDIQTEHRRGPGFALSEAEAKGGLKLVVFSLPLCAPVSGCAGLKGRQKSHFCLRYVAYFHLLSDTGEMMDVQHILWKKIRKGFTF